MNVLGATAAVLVVDDDELTRQLLTRVLERRSFVVHEATCGLDALETLERTEIDVVLLDTGLPDLSGIDVLERIRARPASMTLPVILVTGNAAPTDRVAGLEAGADDYLAKPVDIEELVARVNAQLRGRDAWRSQVEAKLHERARVAGALAALDRSGTPAQLAAEIVRHVVSLRGVRTASIIDLGLDGGARYLAAVTEEGLALVSPGDLVDVRTMAEVQQGLNLGADVLAPDHERRLAGNRGGAMVVASVGGDERPRAVLVLGTDHCDVVNGASELRELLSTAIDLAAVSEHLLMPLLHGQDRGDATANEVRSVIDARAFHPVYQPIVDLQTGRVVGFEALTRFADGVPPDRRFADATRAGLGLDLELVTLAEALRVAKALPASRYLSVNVSPTLLATPELASLLREDHDRPVVVELTEHERVDDYDAITHALDRLGGVRLSVDDAGSGWASLRHVLTLRPHYVKLDRAWVAAVDRDPARQALLLGIGQFVERLGGAVVAEGIEHASECEVLGQLGIRFGQGYHLGRPVPVAEVRGG